DHGKKRFARRDKTSHGRTRTLAAETSQGHEAWHAQRPASQEPCEARRLRQAKKRLANCRLFLILISCPVRQALALCTFEHSRRPFPIVNAEAGPVVVAERKLIQITL